MLQSEMNAHIHRRETLRTSPHAYAPKRIHPTLAWQLFLDDQLRT